jgi:hypothetical protein
MCDLAPDLTPDLTPDLAPDLAAAGECAPAAENEAFIFDLVDVGREYLSIAPCNAAYDQLVNATTPAAVKAANSSMSTVMADLDSLLGSSFGFLLGAWIHDARTMAPEGTNDADFLEWNARSQVTSWFPVDDCNTRKPSLNGLWDYGNKAWSGLVKGYYDKRYQLYADHKLASILSRSSGSSKDGAHAAATAASGGGEGGGLLAPQERDEYHSDVMQLACEFGHTTGAAVPAQVTGDAVAISKALWTKYTPSTM